MFRIAAIIGGVLLLAGVALAGTVASLGSTNPTLSKLQLAASTTVTTATTSRQDDRGREAEARGRANEPGEDLRGQCDEAEHAKDPRCAPGAGIAPVTTGADDDRRGHEQRGHDDGHDRGDDHGGNSGPGGGGESGHGGDD